MNTNSIWKICFIVIILSAIGVFAFLLVYHAVARTEQQRDAMAHNLHLFGPYHLNTRTFTNFESSGAIEGERERVEEEISYVLCLHALFQDNDLTFSMLQLWSDKRQKMIFIVPDLLGCGYSPWPVEKEHYELSYQVDALIRLLDERVPRGSRLFIVAFCFGGAVGIELLARLLPAGNYDIPCFCLAAVPYFASEQEARNMGANYRPTMYGKNAILHLSMMYYGMFRQRWLFGSLINKMLRSNFAAHYESSVDGIMHCSPLFLFGSLENVMACHRLQPATSIIRQFNVPSLLLYGKYDRLCGGDICKRLHDDLGGVGNQSTLKMIEGGHSFNNRKPNETIREIETFILASFNHAPLPLQSQDRKIEKPLEK